MYSSLFARKGLSHDRLRTLLEVHQAGSIVAAAPDAVHRPGQYSRQLSELSAFFGAAVAQREGKVIKLTPFGLGIAAATRDYFLKLSDLNATGQGLPRQYRIAAGDSILHWLVIPRLQPLIGRDAVSFVTMNLLNHQILEQVNDGRFDFGIVRRDSLSKGTKFSPLGKLHYIAVVPNALAKSLRPLTLEKFLTDVPLAVMSSKGQFTSRLRALVEKHGRRYGPGLFCQSFPQVLSAVRSGHYGAVLPTTALPDLPVGSYTTIPSTEFDALTREEALIWNQGMLRSRPGAETVQGFLKDTLKIR